LGLNTLNQIVRHDIKNDLTALGGYLDLLEATELNARQKELIGKMAERAHSADDHLIFAKEKQSIGAVTTAWQDVQATIDNAVSHVDLKGIIVDSRLHNVKLLADPMLPNVFFCLADNTVRHGGRAQNIIIRGEETKTGLSIIWEDDGVGVPSEEKEIIFNRGVGHNTGEGLFLVREILSMTGFSISEEGKPGAGARFVIRVPSGWYTWVRPSTS